MNDDFDLTPMVRAWLHEVPDPSDRARIVSSVHARVHRTPRRRRHPVALRSRGRFFATRLIAVVAFVALGTGALFLAAGQGPSPTPHIVPPHVTPSASPRPSAAAVPSTLVMEQVETDVWHLVTDGAGHDLTCCGITAIVATTDGGVWMSGQPGLFRLGVAGASPGTDGDLRAAPDGRLWSFRSGQLASFDGSTWTSHEAPAPGVGRAFAVLTDGSVWTAWKTAAIPGFRLGHLVDDRWAVPETSDWPVEVTGAFGDYRQAPVADRGDGVWLTAVGGLAGARVLHFDGSAWTSIEGPFGDGTGLATAPDGALWALDGGGGDLSPPGHLARLDAGSWTEYVPPDVIRPGVRYYDEDALFPVVGPDGSVWMRRLRSSSQSGDPPDRCDGVVRFDGASWSTYLPGTCIAQIAPGAGGVS